MTSAGSDHLALIAIGGNSLVRNGGPASYREQYQSLEATCREVAALVTAGWRVVVTHGNGPQVGWLLRRAELAAHELPEIPLDACDASTQGCIGYALQQRLHNALVEAGSRREVLTVVTQVEVDPADPAFDHPNKPIGSFLDSSTAERLRGQGVALMEDAGRGVRRVVPSPRPLRVVEEETIRRLVDDDVVVIAVGGGGIPVVRDDTGRLAGVAAVIDKDLASSLLGSPPGGRALRGVHRGRAGVPPLRNPRPAADRHAERGRSAAAARRGRSLRRWQHGPEDRCTGLVPRSRRGAGRGDQPGRFSPRGPGPGGDAACCLRPRSEASSEMPIYEYRCGGCGVEFSTLWTTVSQAQKEPAACPECGRSGAERLASGFGIGGGGAAPPSADAKGSGDSPRELARTLQRVSRGGRRDLGSEFGEVTARLKSGESATSVERSLRARVGERMQAH